MGSADIYYNNTAITAGTLKLGVANAIPNGGSTTGWLIMDGGASAAGTLDLNGYNQSVNALSGLSGTVLGQIVNNSGSGTSALTVSGGTTTYAGLIEDNNNSTSGKVSLTQSGSGTLTLSGANTYSGGTTVSIGTLALGSTTAIGTGTLTLSGGSLDNSVTSLVNANNNSQNWNSDFTFVGSQSLNLGSGTATMVGGTRAVTVSANTLTVGPISDGGNNYGLTKAGSGTLAFNGQSTFNGTITMNGGNILVNNSYGLGYGAVARNNSTVQLANGVTVTNSLNCPGTDTSDIMLDCPSGAATWSGPLSASGNGGMRLGTTGGTLTLTGPGSFGSRGVLFTYGTVILAGSANFTDSGGTVGIGRDSAGSGRACSLTLMNTASLSTPANGFGGGKVTGPITFTIQDSASFSCGANTFDFHTASSGTSANTVNLNGGTMTVGSFIKSDTTYAATLNLNGGTLKAGIAGTLLPALSALTVNVGTGGANINDNGLAIAIAQPLISGASPDGGLTKLGGGTLMLNAVETYNGSTTISAGTLALSGSGAIANSTLISITNGATLTHISQISFTS